MALYLDRRVALVGVKPQHWVRHPVVDGMLDGMTIAEAVRECRMDYRFNASDQRTYVLRVLTRPDEL